MDIGVRYCGGCNPRYDRKKFIGLLSNLFDHKFEAADTNKEYDLLIVMCGCSSCCANHNKYKAKGQKIMVKCWSDFDIAAEIIRNSNI